MYPALYNLIYNFCSNKYDTLVYNFQFTCGGVDIDVMFSYDWDTDEKGLGGYGALYDDACKKESRQGKHWWVDADRSDRSSFVDLSVGLPSSCTGPTLPNLVNRRYVQYGLQ